MSVFLKLKHLVPSRRRATEDGRRSELGSLTLVAEEGRTVFTWTWLEQFVADLKYACRMMARNPGLAIAAVCSLALGIGANTAIFSLMHSILLKSLSVEDPASLSVITSYSKEGR